MLASTNDFFFDLEELDPLAAPPRIENGVERGMSLVGKREEEDEVRGEDRALDS